LLSASIRKAGKAAAEKTKSGERRESRTRYKGS